MSILHKRKSRVSHSGLCEIKRILLGLPPFDQQASFLRVGRELHSVDLLNKSVCKLSVDDRIMVNNMLDALDLHKFYQRMKKDTQREKVKIGFINGMKVKGHLDILKPGKYVMDLKTTVCESFDEFLFKANEYGYFRQGYIYSVLSGCKEVYFVAVQKQKPFKIFVLNVLDYPRLMDEAKKEVEFLLYYFTKYGFPYESKKRRQKTDKHNAARNFVRKKRTKDYIAFKKRKQTHNKKW